ILLSKRVADDLAQYRQWQRYLHDLGECKVKHDVTVSVVNLYTDEIGNPAFPEKFVEAQKHQRMPEAVKVRASSRRLKSWLIAAPALVALLLVGGIWFFWHQNAP